MSLITAAIRNNNFKEVRKLIKKGINVNIRDGSNYTVLHILLNVWNNKYNSKIFKYLSKKCLLNIQHNGITPLWIIRNDKQRVIICKYGCKLFIKSVNSYTEIIHYMKYDYNRTIDYYLQILI